MLHRSTIISVLFSIPGRVCRKAAVSKLWGVRKRAASLAYVSADGVHWKKLREEPVFTRGIFDSQDVAHHISPPDIVSIKGGNLQVLSGGRVTNKFFKRVRPVKRRPERVELDTIGGMDSAIVQFVVKGKGKFIVTVDSAKAGLLKKNQLLP